MHIGLIGGIGPAATEHYYRGLIAAHHDRAQAMELTIVHADSRDLVQNLTEARPFRQAKIFAALIDRLKGAGAEAAAVTSMGGHFCIDELADMSALPLIDIRPALDAALATSGWRKVGFLGTKTVMSSGGYGKITSVETVAPLGEDLETAHTDYVTLAMAGAVTEDARRRLFALGEKMCREQGADAIVLGGTDLFLAFDGHDPGYPVLDSAAVHVAAIHRRMVGDGT